MMLRSITLLMPGSLTLATFIAVLGTTITGEIATVPAG